MGSFPTLALLAGNDEGVRVGSGYALLVMPSAARHAKLRSSVWHPLS
jgi:hypothetical protein